MFLIDDATWEVKDSSKLGRGVFAKQEIEAGTVIGDYLGKIIHVTDESLYEGDGPFYTMYYSDTLTILPDVNKVGIHLINHSCTPNVWIYPYRGHTLYFSLRKIWAGEEITVSYLISPQDKSCAPCNHICLCESVVCSRTMHLSPKKETEWNTFFDKEARKTKREKTKAGEELSLLPSYPSNVPDASLYPLFGFSKKMLSLPDKMLPTKNKLRKMIRESGEVLQFTNLNMKVLGVLDNMVVSETLK